MPNFQSLVPNGTETAGKTVSGTGTLLHWCTSPVFNSLPAPPSMASPTPLFEFKGDLCNEKLGGAAFRVVPPRVGAEKRFGRFVEEHDLVEERSARERVLFAVKPRAVDTRQQRILAADVLDPPLGVAAFCLGREKFRRRRKRVGHARRKMGASVQLSLWKGLRPLSSVLQVLVVGRYHVPHATAKADLRSKSSCTCVEKKKWKSIRISRARGHIIDPN
eukprot:CAMPEP_0171684222 /NCGR_PEP_ID=MMETSP0991-20121206/1558_1 /TAXON_ID=483369 /ORGANISM="non described non described, Strain CCMP2098" /LENGTH=218 /DNA_ID=CAMNT_0012271705 /DNA_START=164 /DNA_END=819 /DNA_ORIENTATION=+